MGREFDTNVGDRVATDYQRTGTPAKSLKSAFLFAQIRALQTGKRQKVRIQRRPHQKLARYLVQVLDD